MCSHVLLWLYKIWTPQGRQSFYRQWRSEPWFAPRWIHFLILQVHIKYAVKYLNHASHSTPTYIFVILGKKKKKKKKVHISFKGEELEKTHIHRFHPHTHWSDDLNRWWWNTESVFMLLSGEHFRLSADPNHKTATLICAFKNDFQNCH